MAQGSRQPGMEHAVNRAAREQITRDVRGLQQTMADRGGGDAQAYVRQHQVNQIPDRTAFVRDVLLPKGPLDRHPGTFKTPRYPPWMIEKLMHERSKRYHPLGQDLLYPYQDEEDLPEGILQTLKTYPSFDLENFKNIGWGKPENAWFDGGKGLQGVYFGDFPEGPLPLGRDEPPPEKFETPMISKKMKMVYATPSGPPSERVWDPEKLNYPKEDVTQTYSDPYTGTINIQHLPFKESDETEFIANPNIPTSYGDESLSSNRDKIRTIMHELRHKKFNEDPELWESQPEWVKNVESPETEEYWQNQGKYMTGHELYNRFLDQRYSPPTRIGGEPYFDKILSDYWEPSAKEFERISQAQDLGERYSRGGILGAF